MSEVSSASTTTVAGSPPEYLLTLPPAAAVSSSTQAFNFSSGNPRIEETRGVVHLYSQDYMSSSLRSSSSSSSELPVGRKTLVCVLGVPNHMTYADFCQFCGTFIQHILEMRVVRADGEEDRYSVLIKFDDQSSTDAFYKHFNGKVYSSLEADACNVFFTVDVQYTGSIEHVHASPTSSTEQPTCPVCLERLDQDTGGILTTICNHSFHCACISNWADSSCPVCRYCQQQPEKSICIICQTSENLWICVICGFVGCGRNINGHAINHWKETQHCYSLEVETQRVWDYAGDNYVHRLIQSKTDGKLVELNHNCRHAGDDFGSCNCSTDPTDPAFSEALVNSRVDNIVNEYSELLTTQLENQKVYFESLLREVDEEIERDTADAIEKAISGSQKLSKMQSKLDKLLKEKKFLDELNEYLVKNMKIWDEKIIEAEEREKKALALKNAKNQELEQQLSTLMLSLDTSNKVEQVANSDETKDSVPVQIESSSKKVNPERRK